MKSLLLKTASCTDTYSVGTLHVTGGFESTNPGT
jgi:hypothetical protein